MIKTVTVNVDGNEVASIWDTLDELKEEWNSDDWPGPSLDDEVISAVVDGIDVDARIFKDVMDFIKDRFGFDY